MQTDLPLLDLQFGLSQLSGNESLLFKLLDKFRLEYQDFDHRVTPMLEQQQFADAKQAVHTLKGVAGNLGLNALHAHCKQLEDAIKGESPVEQPYADLIAVLEQTLAHIQSLTNAPQEAAAPTGGNDAEARAKLTDSLQRNEFIPADDLDDLLNALSVNPEQASSIRQAINDLNYPQALSLLGA